MKDEMQLSAQPASTDTIFDWSPYISYDEELIWQGRPLSGWFMSLDDLRRLVFTLVVALILILYIRTRAGGDQFVFTVLVITVLGLIWEFYRVSFGRKYVLERTRYALSPQHIWIKNARKLHRYAIDDGLIFHLSSGEKYDSLLFRQKKTFGSLSASFFKKKPNAESSGFLNILDGETLYRQLISLQNSQQG